METKSTFHGFKLLSKSFTDISVVVEGQSYKCHKIILGSVSEFFERLLLSDCKETAKGEILLEDVKSSTFEIFLEFIYNGCEEKILEPRALNTLFDLLEFGDKFFVLCITELCTKILKCRIETLGLEDLIVLFEKAHTFNNDELITTTISCFKSRKDKKMNCESALGLRSDIFEEYVKCAENILEEVERFELIEKWIKNQDHHETVSSFIDLESNAEPSTVNGKYKGHAHTAILNQLLNLIDYKNMSVAAFKSGPGKSDVLDDLFKYRILHKLNSASLQNGCYGFNNNYFKIKGVKGATQFKRKCFKPKVFKFDQKAFDSEFNDFDEQFDNFDKQFIGFDKKFIKLDKMFNTKFFNNK